MKNLLTVFSIVLLTQVAFANSSSATKVDIRKKTFIKRPHLRQDESFQSDRAKFVAKRRATLIQDLKGALRAVKDKEQLIELKHRLANLYIEEFKYQAQQGSDSRSYLRTAQGLFKELAETAPQSARHDEYLFQLAQSHLEFGQIDQAHQAFSILLKQHPESPFKEEAYIQLADYAFERGQFSKALEYFSKLLENANSPLLLYAYYKSAWASYNLSRLKDSLTLFRKVIDTEEAQGSSHHSLALKKEAIRDICLPLADLKRYDEGTQFYQEQGDPIYRKGVECLASLAQERGDFKDALQLYRHLLNLDTHYSGNPQYSISSVEVLKKQDRLPETLAALEESLSTYLGNSSWREIYSSEPKTIESVRSEHESLTRKYALDVHAVAQKTKNPVLYKAAHSFYQLYLAYFPLTVEASKMQFYLAEIDYKEKHYEQAAEGYQAVYKNPQTNSELKLTALNYALMACSAQINEERKRTGQTELLTGSHKKRSQNESDEFVPYSPTEERFFLLGEEFLAKYPQDKKASEVLFQMSYLKYMHHDNKPAYLAFWKLINKYPSHSHSVYAGLLLLDILNQKNDYQNMIAASKKLLATPQLTQEKFKAEVADILRKSELKHIAELEEQKQFETAGNAYLAFTQKYGSQDPSLFEKALFNAGVCFSQAQLTEKALNTREAFLKQFPQSKLRSDLLLQVAKTHEASTEFGKAAFYFELFHKENPQHPQSQEALRLAGFYYWGSGNREKAESSMLDSLRKFPQSRETVGKDLLEFYQMEQMTSKEQDLLLTQRAAKGVSFADYLGFTLQLADLSEALRPGKPNSYWNEAGAIVDKYSSTLLESKKGGELMGRVLLRGLEQRLRHFDSVRLKLPQAELERSLSAKMRMLKELETEAARLAKLGGDSGLAALHHISRGYEVLAKEIQDAPVPKELTGEQLEIYRNELAKQMVLPLSEKAKSFAQTCLDKAQELSLASPWVGHCYQQASRLDPEAHPWFNTYATPPYFVSFTKTGLQDLEFTNSLFQSSAFFKDSLKDRGVTLSQSSVALLSYQPLLEKRESDFPVVRNLAEQSSPEDHWKAFNTLRIHHPQEAIRQVKGFIRKHPEMTSFHNLLALAYLDNGEYEKAKITWLSLLARGVSDPAITNNLGVLEAIKGNVQGAERFFAQSAKENHTEAFINQGLIALSTRNGALARTHFEKALEMENPIAMAQVGRAVALVQTNQIDEAKDALQSLRKDFSSDPLIEQQLQALNQDKSSRDLVKEIPSSSETSVRIRVAEPSTLPDLE